MKPSIGYLRPPINVSLICQGHDIAPLGGKQDGNLVNNLIYNVIICFHKYAHQRLLAQKALFQAVKWNPITAKKARSTISERKKRYLPCPFSKKDSLHCSHDDHQIHKNRYVFDIEQIVVQFFFGVFNRSAIGVIYLGPSRNSGFN